MRQLVSSDNQAVAFELPIFTDSIDGESIQTVNARDLHRELEVGRDFSHWIKDRISKYGFTDGVDFCSLNLTRKDRGGHNKIEYHISFDMAKELAMVEANQKGQQLRRYFIRKEKEARLLSPSEPVSPYTGLAKITADKKALAELFGLSGNQALLSAARATEQMTGYNPIKMLGVELKADRKEKTFTVTELGKTCFDGLSGRKVNQLLMEAGLQVKAGKHWELTEAGKDHAELLDTGKSHSNGTPVKQIKWFRSVVDCVQVA